MSSRPIIWIIDGHLKQPFYAPLREQLEWARVESVTSARAALGPCREVDLLLMNDDGWHYTGAAAMAFRRERVPTLFLADGILEWCNLWENPRSREEAHGSPLFQPLLADKIACLGQSQARFLEALGNRGRCEITGTPRFDPLLGLRRRDRRKGEPLRIMVASATTPAFNDAQRRLVESSLRDLKHWFDSHPVWNGVSVSPVWRLTGDLDAVLGIDPAAVSAWPNLATQLSGVDALITTPSTLQLEAMLVGVPVAVLDYANRPPLVPAAYAMTAASHLDAVLPDLLAPSASRLWLQEALLDDALYSKGATPRVAELARRLVELGRHARAVGKPLELPTAILPRPSAQPRPAPAPEALNPGHPILLEHDLAALQAEVARLRRALRLTPSQIVYRSLCEIQKLLYEWRRR